MPDDSPSHSLVPVSVLRDASLDELLALAAQKYRLEFEQVSAGGVTLDIAQIANMRELLDAAITGSDLHNALTTLPLWAKIWPASVILGHVLSQVPPPGHRVLEIGAGCGVTGLVAAALGFERVVISDINEDALLFARINILKNGLQEKAEVQRVDVQADMAGERFSLIIASEILYLEPLYRPLVKFLKRRLLPAGSRPTPEILLATDHRRNAKPFFKRAEKEFQISHKQIGVKASDDGVAAPGERPERHLLSIHRLRHPG